MYFHYTCIATNCVLNMLKTMISVVQFVIFLIIGVKGQLSEKEELMNVTTCQLEPVNLDCDVNKVLAIQSLDYRYRDGCDTTTNCCTDFDETDDTPDQYDYPADMMNIRRSCSGQSSCTVPLSGAGVYGTKGFKPSASYVVVDYFCIQESRITDVCSDTSLQSSDSPLYLTNTNYPSKPTGSDTCACSFEVLSCLSSVNLYILDADLYHDTDMCDQTISIINRENVTTSVIDCDNYYRNKINIETINSHYITANFHDDTPNNNIDGYFFIGLSGTETNAILTLNCSSVEETMCMAYRCGDVYNIDHGTITLNEANNSTDVATASVTCDNGYETQNMTITCQASGLWENTSCTIKDCGNVPDIDFGIITLDEANITTYGANATADCIIGYETEKNETITCQESGIWQSTSCTIKVCGDVPNIMHGFVTLDVPDKTTYGSTATVSCASGNTTIYCLETGKWENSSCPLIECGPVANIEYGSITLNDISKTTYGSTANITCISGYETKDSTISCLVTGIWQNASCTKIVSYKIPVLYIGIGAGILVLVVIVLIAIVIAKRRNKNKSQRKNPYWAKIDEGEPGDIDQHPDSDNEHYESKRVSVVSWKSLSESNDSSPQ